MRRGRGMHPAFAPASATVCGSLPCFYATTLTAITAGERRDVPELRPTGKLKHCSFVMLIAS